MQPWLSIIMPIHNGAAYLEPTLRSLTSLDLAGVELLLYDSSDDPTEAPRIARQFEDRLVLSWKPGPCPKAWQAKINRGAAEARAPVIAILHQDDLLLPGHLAAVRESLERFPNVTMSIGPSRFIGPDDRMLGTWNLPFAAGLHAGAEIAETLIVQNSIAVPSPAIRRDAFLACGGMDEELWYTPDWDLYLKLARGGDVAVRDGATSAFRIHDASLTMTGSRNLADFHRQHEIVLDRHLAALASSTSRATLRRANASVAVNCALAAARSNGAGRQLLRVLHELFKLGPIDCARYLRQSRLIDRLVPRLKLMLAGGLRT